MWVWVNMMTTPSAESELGARLERLSDRKSCCDAAEYRSLATKVVRTEAFARALGRAKALADERRLLALALLQRQGELCACEIQAASKLDHATVSHHMGVLVAAGLVEARREGKWKYYRIPGPADGGIP
jgi:ArsR family transcriptional regulator, arsenate/arsenite/antimonite-responsive transcriptional repressor